MPLVEISLTEGQASCPGINTLIFLLSLTFFFPLQLSSYWPLDLPSPLVDHAPSNILLCLSSFMTWSILHDLPTQQHLCLRVVPTFVNIFFYRCLIGLAFMTSFLDDSIHHWSLDPPTQQHNIMVYTCSSTFNMFHQYLMSFSSMALHASWLDSFLVTSSINTTTMSLFKCTFHPSSTYSSTYAWWLHSPTQHNNIHPFILHLTWLQSSVLVQVFSEQASLSTNHKPTSWMSGQIQSRLGHDTPTQHHPYLHQACCSIQPQRFHRHNYDLQTSHLRLRHHYITQPNTQNKTQNTTQTQTQNTKPSTQQNT